MEIDEVSRVYGSGQTAVHALRPCTATLRERDFVAVMGPSGSGKTTLLQLAAGLDRPSAGEVRLRGDSLAQMTVREMTRMRRREIGFVFQFFNLVDGLDAVENVALPLRFDGMPGREARARADEYIEMVGMGHRRLHLPSQMSGGEMQRIAVARALAPRPSVLIADEPTGNLDGANSREVLSLLRDLAKKNDVAVLMATHDAGTVRYADRLWRLDDGTLVEEAVLDEDADPPSRA
ncbi:hypothetical protein ASE19_08385 [Nocardioides sp. Root79]|nr:hypothetical protein ASE19_08385 [Nocardioides sp. Root79]KRC71549.1 hypothetical protein ASE20_10800 [Nocardioides sp. Root240]